jgi:hypothetical protein
MRPACQICMNIRPPAALTDCVTFLQPLMWSSVQIPEPPRQATPCEDIGTHSVMIRPAEARWVSDGAQQRLGKKTCAQRETLTIAGFALDGTKWDGLYVGRRKGDELVYAARSRLTEGSGTRSSRVCGRICDAMVRLLPRGRGSARTIPICLGSAIMHAAALALRPSHRVWLTSPDLLPSAGSCGRCRQLG